MYCFNSFSFSIIFYFFSASLVCNNWNERGNFSFPSLKSIQEFFMILFLFSFVENKKVTFQQFLFMTSLIQRFYFTALASLKNKIWCVLYAQFRMFCLKLSTTLLSFTLFNIQHLLPLRIIFLKQKRTKAFEWFLTRAYSETFREGFLYLLLEL